MKFIKKIILIVLLFIQIVSLPLSSKQNKGLKTRIFNLNATSKFYESMFEGDKPNIAMLTLFCTKMPKGGDIHHHFSGSLYAETFLDWIKKKNWFIDKKTLRIVKKRENEKQELLTVDQLISDNDRYRKLLTLWSDKDYQNHDHLQPPPDSEFFKTFGYFRAVSHEYMNLGFNIIKQRAIRENVDYIECMVSRVGIKSKNCFAADKIKKFNNVLRKSTSQREVNKILDQMSEILFKNNGFNSSVNQFITMVQKSHQGIDDKNFTMRYQTYPVRVFPPVQFFADLLAAYIVVEKSPIFVGVNIVAPENNTTALADYTLHMQMFNYLGGKYPKANCSLHAGELTLGMVSPGNLTFHIKQARDIADAQRIGHGVTLPYEQDSLSLLEDLKKNAVIEINLTSNQFVLGVKGDSHPYRIYSSYGVPLVICTDDSGILRNNLSNEYMLLASRYQPDYLKIKEYVYNSIKYSFLTYSRKAYLKTILDQKFLIFEREIADLYKKFDR
ncbi:adenosine deaminase [bacterium]|nr:adenosine deaminase [bacterium]